MLFLIYYLVYLNNLNQLEALKFEDERLLKNIRQLTFGGSNAEGYFRFDFF